MIGSEYFCFLQTIITDGVPADVRKIANILQQHLDTLTPLSTVQGQRIKKMVKLTQANRISVSPDIQPISEQIAEQTSPIYRLKSLSVLLFRGFIRQENFDLTSQLLPLTPGFIKSL